MVEHPATPTVGEMVANDHRAAAVMERFGIDFCCGGARSLEDACAAAGAELSTVTHALETLAPAAGAVDDFVHWPAQQLIDHIVSTHHAYVRSALPVIARHLQKLEQVHGERHPELRQLADVFAGMSVDLEQHLVKEERVLFPYIRDLATNPDAWVPAMSPFGTIENPIRMMEREHQEAAGELRFIRELTNGYLVPADGCATYTACMRELEQFERDLHEHVHLENNVLFPKAIQMERVGWQR